MKEIFKITNITKKYFRVLLLLLSIKIYSQNEISLIIDKTKGTDIIYHSYYSSISEVEVNGKLGNIHNYTYLLNKNTNNVRIKFNEYLDSCDSMFYELNNILSIDFSNFVSSNVKSTINMFYDCSSLITLNLNNFDTSLVTNMEYMFHYCKNLESLNINNVLSLIGRHSK